MSAETKDVLVDPIRTCRNCNLELKLAIISVMVFLIGFIIGILVAW